MFTALFREKPARVLLVLRSGDKEWYVSRLARESQVTYVYLSKFLPRLEKAGLIRSEKKGKKRWVTLTEKGLDVAQLLDELKRKMEPPKEPTLPAG